MKIISGIGKWIVLGIATLILDFFGAKILNSVYPKINIDKNWFYHVIYIIFSFKVNLLSLILSITTIWIIYILISYLITINKKFRVIKATYGTDNIREDFTKKLNDSIVEGSIYVYLTNGFVGKDPVHGVQKRAKIKYKHNDEIFDIEIVEGNLIQLPAIPEHKSATLPS